MKPQAEHRRDVYAELTFHDACDGMPGSVGEDEFEAVPSLVEDGAVQSGFLKTRRPDSARVPVAEADLFRVRRSSRTTSAFFSARPLVVYLRKSERRSVTRPVIGFMRARTLPRVTLLFFVRAGCR